MEKFDLTIIGGGIVGLATAMRMAREHPGLRCAVLEKEPELGMHQTGHNSGVLHSGIYYRPGSVKARTCVAGKKALLEFCDEAPHPLRPVRQGHRRHPSGGSSAPGRVEPARRGQRRRGRAHDRPGGAAGDRAPLHRTQGAARPVHRHHRLRQRGAGPTRGCSRRPEAPSAPRAR